MGLLALIIYVSLLPFQPFFPPITSGIVAFWLVAVLSFTKDKFSGLWQNKLFLISAVFYLWLVIGTLYSPNQHEAGLDITLKITMLLWPMGAAIWPALYNKNQKLLLGLFATLAAISVLLLVIIGFYKWQISGENIHHFYKYTTTWEWIPNHYIALYASFSILILLFLAIKKSIKKTYLILLTTVLIATMAFTSVRIQLLALPLAVLAFIFMERKEVRLRKRILTFAFSGIALLFLGVMLFPSSRERLAESVDELRSINKMVNNKQTNHRVFIWRYGWQVANENLLLGTGTGAGDDALNIALEDCKAEFWNGKRTYHLSENRYNYHNAFLQHFATNGLIGLLLFMLLFAAPLVVFGKNLNGLQLGFLVLCAVSFFTESMLERQAGVLFFSFFYALLFVAPLADTSNISGKNTA